jgi:hypothetical protein
MSSGAGSIGPRCVNLFQGPKPTMQTIDGIPVERRASSSHRHRHPSALGELLYPATPIRVSSLLPAARGRDEAEPSILFRSDGRRRPILLRAPAAADGWALLSACPGAAPACSWTGMGRPDAVVPRPA